MSKYLPLNKDLINIIHSHNLPCLDIIKKRKLFNKNQLENESRSIYNTLELKYCYDKNLRIYDNLQNTKITKFKHIGTNFDTYWTIIKN